MLMLRSVALFCETNSQMADAMRLILQCKLSQICPAQRDCTRETKLNVTNKQQEPSAEQESQSWQTPQRSRADSQENKPSFASLQRQQEPFPCEHRPSCRPLPTLPLQEGLSNKAGMEKLAQNSDLMMQLGLFLNPGILCEKHLCTCSISYPPLTKPGKTRSLAESSPSGISHSLGAVHPPTEHKLLSPSHRAEMSSRQDSELRFLNWRGLLV